MNSDGTFNRLAFGLVIVAMLIIAALSEAGAQGEGTEGQGPPTLTIQACESAFMEAWPDPLLVSYYDLDWNVCQVVDSRNNHVLVTYQLSIEDRRWLIEKILRDRLGLNKYGG